ncbi:MAG TPA: hypothetical protein VFL79_16885 [Terriglobia bacterium]|nr:hypothetical protein [Terriglobia bacterium]
MLQSLKGQTRRGGLSARRAGFPRGLAWSPGDSCGCEMGARFLAVAVALASVWYAWHWPAFLFAPWASLLRVFLWLFLAAIAGKAVGIIAYLAHRRKSSFRTATPHQL